jgi:hypothetical protein
MENNLLHGPIPPLSANFRSWIDYICQITICQDASQWLLEISPNSLPFSSVLMHSVVPYLLLSAIVLKKHLIFLLTIFLVQHLRNFFTSQPYQA